MNKVEIDKLKSSLKDYVLMMLGAPTVVIELNEEQIETCINYAFQSFEGSLGEKLSENYQLDDEGSSLLQTSSLAFAKIALGRIRSKFDSVPACEKGLKLDGKVLLREGLGENKEFHEKMINYIPNYKFTKIEQSEIAVNVDAKGILVFYVNVGQLPPFKAEAFIERMKDKFRLQEVKKLCEVVYIPVRDQETKVEYISFE